MVLFSFERCSQVIGSDKISSADFGIAVGQGFFACNEKARKSRIACFPTRENGRKEGTFLRVTKQDKTVIGDK